MKASEQLFPVVLFVMPWKVVLTFESVDETVKCEHLMKASCSGQCSPVVLFIMLYKAVLTFEPVDESLSFTIQMVLSSSSLEKCRKHSPPTRAV